MSFNALSIAKLGVGFGALAVASIGLLSPAPAIPPTGGVTWGNSAGAVYMQRDTAVDKLQHSQDKTLLRARINHDDDEVMLLITAMLGEIL